MNTQRFDFNLPQQLIAQTPASRREDSRLLVYQRNQRRMHHCQFKDIAHWLPSQSHLFRNTVSVLPARLRAQRASGGQLECFLLKPDAAPDTWSCLLKPGKKLKPGERFFLPDHLAATLLGRTADGLYRVQFQLTDACPTVETLAQRYGSLPLPPYIVRAPAPTADSSADTERYQTVYADPTQRRAVAAPTAGLHFTDAIFTQLQAGGIDIHDLVLEVGLGTFRPIQTDTLDTHQMHSEAYTLFHETRQVLHRSDPGLRLAVGTTTLRAIEDYSRKFDLHNTDITGDYRGSASLFLYPPASFNAVDALLTNFHLPRSTLLCLVAAFLAPDATDGVDLAHHIYQTAIQMEYRFFSYGDAMLIL